MKIEEMPPAQYTEDCEGWWLSGYRSSVIEHGQLKPGSILSDYSLFTFCFKLDCMLHMHGSPDVLSNRCHHDNHISPKEKAASMLP